MIVPAHKATVVALIVDELATNAVRHGLCDCASGTLTVGLRRAGADSVALSIADDGGPVKGIGLNLVRRPVDRVGGELQVEAEPKRFVVVFASDGGCR